MEKKIFKIITVIRLHSFSALKQMILSKTYKILEDLFDFSNLNKNHEIFSNKNRKVVGKFKIETPENLWIDEFVCLRSKAYSYKCNDKNTNKLKGITNSETKMIKFDDYYNCLFCKRLSKGM